MSLSCDCSWTDIFTVGEPREVVCRHGKPCTAFGKTIKVNSPMYFWSMFDFNTNVPVAPAMLCEECGDMAMNLLSLGFCMHLGESIREQWLDYLEDTEPNNIAVKLRREG